MREKHENTTTAVTNPEQEKFYRNINDVVDRNKTELTMLEGYGKYRFWKAFFSNPFVQVPLFLAFIGLTVAAEKTTQNASDFTGRLIVVGILLALAFVAVLILGKIYQLITWPIRLFREAGGYKHRPWWLGYANPDSSTFRVVFWFLLIVGMMGFGVYGLFRGLDWISAH
jgi:hypothetical protein